jgi:hypothetical protein
MRGVAAALLLAGCGTTDTDIVGPFTGETRRFAVDAIYLPASNTQAREFGGDLTGDAIVDNQLGMVISTLRSQGNVTDRAADMIAGGAITSSIEIVADDFENDPTVGVRYLGTPDSAYVELGGYLEDGWFHSNLTATTRVAGEAELHLPVFVEADPSLVAAIGMQIILTPDGEGGFDASIHGAVPTGSAFDLAVHRGISQTIASDPAEHRVMMNLFDTNKDGDLTVAEVTNNSLLRSLLAPDVTLHGRNALSVGFRAHLRPCADEQCLSSVPFDHCFDRLRDGDETDVDCGGSCRGCEAGAACAVADDCETVACDAGSCGPPSCTNGARDGLETEVDCGGGCPGCAIGQRCYFGTDCASGECGVPCVSDDPWDCLGDAFNTSADTCHPRPLP